MVHLHDKISILLLISISKPGFKKINIPNAKIMIPPPIDHHIFTISL